MSAVQQEWRLITSGHLKGARNMAVDEAISEGVARGWVPPTLRFYGWKPACLSLGYAQKASEADFSACAARGIEVVRRPTGGRAILHDQEVTYSIIAREDNHLVSGSIMESYLKISQGLLRGLHRLGIQAEMSAHKDLNGLGTAACFDSPSFYEMVVAGKKIVGSAQTRKNGTVLQHGSVIRKMNVDTLFDILTFPGPEIRSRMKVAFERKACSLQDVVDRELTDSEIIEALSAGFTQAWGIRLIPGVLTTDEQQLAENLEHSKYTSREWIGKR